MQGDIRLESEKGVGTKAIVTLPLERRPPPAPKLVVPSVVGYPPPADLSVPASETSPGRALITIGRRSKSDYDQSDNSKREDATPIAKARHLELVSQYSPVKRRDVHVLLAEDNRVIQTIAVRAIKKLGFSVSAVWNGKEALDYISGTPTPSRPQASIVLMDCQMPVMDGYAATRALRHEEPFVHDKRIANIPVIAVSTLRRLRNVDQLSTDQEGR